MKFVKATLILAFLLLCRTQCYSQVIITDSFPGNSLDSDLWENPVSNSGSLTPYEGKLGFSTEAVSTASASVAWKSTFASTSLLNSTVDLSVPGLADISGNIMLRLGLRIRNPALHKIFYIALASFDNSISGSGSTSWKLDSYGGGSPSVYVPASGDISVRISYDPSNLQLVSYYNDSAERGLWKTFNTIDASSWSIGENDNFIVELYAERLIIFSPGEYTGALPLSADFGFSNFAVTVPEPSSIALVVPVCFAMFLLIQKRKENKKLYKITFC